jgi:hypothetical protein
MRRFNILLCTIASLLFSCNNTSPKAVGDDVTLVKTKTAHVYLDSIIDNSLCVPCDTVFDLSILIPDEQHHGDQVPRNSDARTWFGLFKSGNRYYVDSTKIKLTFGYDPIVDPDDSSERTGVLVHALHNDTSILLIADSGLPLNYATESLVKSQRVPYPEDDTINYTCNGTNYKLYSSATKGLTTHYSDTCYLNYKLYLTSVKNGKTITQILVARPVLQYGYDLINFIGDIDGDGMPDILFDLGEENASVLTLYLSRNAGSGAILKVVAQSVYTGC